MKKISRVFSPLTPFLKEKFGTEQSKSILSDAQEKWEQLCAENKSESKAVKAHTVKSIYPCIALYEALQKTGIPREEAAAFLDRSYCRSAEPKAASMRALTKLPGMYKQMPAIFKWVAVHQFGVKAGFRAVFYPTEHTRVKFDMTKCLYCDVLKKYGYPELIPCFCHMDDVTDGNIHPKLCWNRTKIMGDGADCCDFDLFVKEEPKQ